MIAAPGIDEIRAAAQRIRGSVRRTPLLAAAPIKEKPELACGLRLKLEALQVTGSFKARGAINAVFALPPEQLRRGIVTASGGNHGLAVAYAGWATKVPATIFLPRLVAADKIEKLDAWGAQVVMAGEVWDDSNRAALQHAEAENLSYIHPFADPAVIAGQGTIALEILEEAPDLDTLLVAIGGGGLISGIAVAAKAIDPGIRVIGVQAAGAASMHASLKAGEVIRLESFATIADGIAVGQPGELTYAHVAELVDEVVTVTEEDIARAMVLLIERAKLVVEPAGAVGVAALLAGVVSAQTPAVAVLSGGNIDPTVLARVVKRASAD